MKLFFRDQCHETHETEIDLLNFKQLRMAQGDTNSAKREAQEAYDKALLLRNMTQGSSDMFSDLLRRMEDFQHQRGARPAEIRAVRIKFLLNHCIVNALC